MFSAESASLGARTCEDDLSEQPLRVTSGNWSVPSHNHVCLSYSCYSRHLCNAWISGAAPIRFDHIPYRNKLIAKANISVYLDAYVK